MLQIFDAMEKTGIGMDRASDAIIVSKALKRIQKEQNLPPAQAIESLTSCLTTMKLLGKLESQSQSLPSKDRDELESGLSAARSSPSTATSSSVTTRTSSLQSSQATALDNSNSDISNMSEVASTSLTSPRKNVKNGQHSKRRLSKSAKQTRIRKEGDNNGNNNNSLHDPQPSSAANDDHTDLDAKVVQKVILQKTVGNGTAQNQGNNDPAPSTITNNRMKSPPSKVSREKRDLDPIVQVQGQPTTKRQRLDSI